MFGRKKAKQDGVDEAVDPLDDATADEAPESVDGDVADADDGAPEPEQGPAFDRSSGPFDISEVEDTSAHADFGGLLVPGVQGLNLRLEADPATGQLVAMTMVFGQGAVQVRATAAPRSGGLWDSSREGLRSQVEASGGRTAVLDGPFGTELQALVPVPADQPGGPGLRPMRFVGVEGPRWMLSGAFMGAGTDPQTWAELNELFRRLIVVRGEGAMPVGALLAFRPPEQPEPEPEQEATTLESLEPGDKITEVR